MPYKIRHKGSGFKVTTPNHPQGFSKHPMSKTKAGAQLRAIKMHTNEEMAQAVVDTLLAEHCGNCPGDAEKVDQAELRMGTKDEREEHDMPPKTARKTALQHLLRVDPHYYTKTEKCLGESFEEYESVVNALLGAWAVRALYKIWLNPESRRKLVSNWHLFRNDAKALWNFLKGKSAGPPTPPKADIMPGGSVGGPVGDVTTSGISGGGNM